MIAFVGFAQVGGGVYALRQCAMYSQGSVAEYDLQYPVH